MHQNTSVVPTAGAWRQPNRSVHSVKLRRAWCAEFPRWVPLMLEMMDPAVSRKPPDKALLRPRPRSGDEDKTSSQWSPCSPVEVNKDPY